MMLPIPDHMYDRLMQIAEETSQPVEEVVLQRLESGLIEPFASLPLDEQAELRALTNSSDEALWTIARDQMASDLQARMQMLMDKNNFGTISSEEYDELSTLVEEGQRLMLRKGQAAALLTRRGYDLRNVNLTPTDE
jgi:hypothetical protein